MEQYAVLINGIRHVQQLDEKDAKRLGLTDKDKVKAPANKAAAPAAK